MENTNHENYITKMKKVFLSLTLLLMVTLLSAQNLATIEGVWERGKPGFVKLFDVENGFSKELASSRVGEDGRFVFSFYPSQEGFYVIGFAPGRKQHSYTFYVKPGDHLSVKITPTSYELIGKNNSAESKEMARWEEFMAPLEIQAHNYDNTVVNTYVEFFPLLEEKEEELKTYKVKETSNKVFNEKFKRFQELNFLDAAMGFLFYPRAAHPQGEDYPDYFRNLDINNYATDEFILSYPEGLRIFSQITMAKRWASPTQMTEEEMAKIGPHTGILDNENFMKNANPVVLGELVLLNGSNKRTLLGLDEYIGTYGKYLVNDSQKKRMDNMRLPLIKNEKGDPAHDFAFPDVDGKVHALSDYKGKVVYVDVWATWCGPCRKEIPDLKKLEEEFKDNKDIVFIGVSVDKTKDEQKWRDFLVEEALPGIQIFAGDNADDKLMNLYKISGIPRFILVGKDGNLVYGDAPRPSSPEIKPLLDSLLKK